MTDKELLKLAAKAAGIELKWNEYYEYWVCQEFPRIDNDWKRWDPLEDDGDAFKLVVKLSMDVTFNDVYVCAFPADELHGSSELYHVCDPYASARRAIVRAAAEIGKTL